MTKVRKLTHGESNIFDRELVKTVIGIANQGEKFKLENGYYINEKDTIFLKSNANTGKFFRKD